MLPTATIVFREFLEIALVITIVMAATRGLAGRLRLITLGLAAGIAGSALIGMFTGRISAAVDGMGKEVFDAAIMFTAAGFLSWTVLWMKRHGRELSENLKRVGSDVAEGRRPVGVIVTVIALATLREGAEIVLFTHGMLASGQFAIADIVSGALLGAVGGTAVGLMLYFGLLTATRRHMLQVTGWMLIFLTAGMAAQGVGLLVAADILPALQPRLWDSSDIISGHSMIGEMLGVLIGYTPSPSAMEVLCYALVLATIGGLYHYNASQPPPRKSVRSSAS